MMKLLSDYIIRKVGIILALTLPTILVVPTSAIAQQSLGFDDVAILTEVGPTSIAGCGSDQHEWRDAFARHVLLQTWKRLQNEGLSGDYGRPSRFEKDGQNLSAQCERSILRFMAAQFDESKVIFPSLPQETTYSYSYRDGLRTNMHLELLQTIGEIFQLLPQPQTNSTTVQSSQRIGCQRDTTNNALGLNLWICDCGSYSSGDCRQIMRANGCEFDTTGILGLCAEDISGR